MRTIYVFDTSTLIYDPCAWKQFPHSYIVIPIAVLSELDKLKKQSGEVGRNARIAIRLLDEISNKGDISTGILLDDDVLLKIDAVYITPNLDMGDSTYGDTHILMCAYRTYVDHPTKDVILVSNDINLRVKAKSRGLAAISHEDDKFSLTDLYPGIQTIDDEKVGMDLQRNSVIDPRLYNIKLNPHECVLFTDQNDDGIAMGRKVAHDKLKLIRKQHPWQIQPRNKEQSFAIDLIMDKNVDLVTLIGKAGTGKSLIVLACALDLVISKREYDKFVIYRPIQPVGNDIGYLPGPQPLDAKILTPDGWTTMGQIKINDFVIGSDGTSKKVLGVFPKGTKDIYRVTFSDGSSTECCDDHLWYTTSQKEEQRKGSIGSVKSLKEIRETLKTYKTQINNHKIPMIQPVQFSKKEHIIHPYILGFLLGDGTFAEDYSISFTSSDTEIADICNTLLPNDIKCKIRSEFENNSFSYSFIMKENENRLHRTANVFNAEINRLELRHQKYGTKFIPKNYLLSSVDDRLSLLQGLMDSDGFVSDDGTDVSYSTTSLQLAKNVQFLAQSLGGRANINDKLSHDKFGKEIHYKNVSIYLPDCFVPFKLKRKVDRFKHRKNELNRMIDRIDFVGQKEAQCILIESDDHLYATDHFILTHNTMQEKLAPWFQAIMDNFEMLFSNKVGGDWRRDLEMYQKKGRIEMEAITYIRGRSIPNAIVLVDECQNLNKEEVKTILTRAGENTKIILTGDIEQIDNSVLDATNNGLTHVIEKFKDSELAGHITFTQGERSKLATQASEIL